MFDETFHKKNCQVFFHLISIVITHHCLILTLISSFFQVSIVAMQRGEQLVPFKTRSGDTLEILYLEELSAEVMMVN